MPKHEQKLLSTIACFRSPVEHKTIESIAENKDTLDKDLHDLVDRGLLHFDEKNKKFDLHPIVRRYAYERLLVPERTGVHGILVIYFEAVPPPPKIEKLEDLAPIIELYHHTVRAGNLDESLDLLYHRLHNSLYYQFGAYQLCIELLRALFPDGEDKPPRVNTKRSRSWVANSLANSYSLSGQPANAVRLFLVSAELDESDGNKKNLAIDLGNMADDQLKIGALNEAERNLRQNIELSHDVSNDMQEAFGNYQLARTFSYLSYWENAEKELDTAEEIFEKINHVQGVGLTYLYRALRFLLMAREVVVSNQSQIANLKSSIQCVQRALKLADEQAKDYPVPRDYVHAHWLLGAAYRANNDLTLAEENLSQALNLCRQINSVEMEADILLDLARLRYVQGDFKDAQEKAFEALMITERSGYVLQGADVNLFLAQYALEQEQDKAKAKQYAEEARKLAMCDGPPYYYKVANEEAERFLENLK